MFNKYTFPFSSQQCHHKLTSRNHSFWPSDKRWPLILLGPGKYAPGTLYQDFSAPSFLPASPLQATFIQRCNFQPYPSGTQMSVLLAVGPGKV